MIEKSINKLIKDSPKYEKYCNLKIENEIGYRRCACDSVLLKTPFCDFDDTATNEIKQYKDISDVMLKDLCFFYIIPFV